MKYQTIGAAIGGIPTAHKPAQPLTFTALEDSAICFTGISEVSNDSQYSIDGGNTWLSADRVIVLLSKGKSVQYRNTLLDNQDREQYASFSITGKVAASGNIMSMIDADDWESLTEIQYEYAFYRLFSGCTGLTTAPEFPATTLASYCYSYILSGCTGLTTAPELPATTLAPYCYGAMFFGCTGLTIAPELPATTLASYCYGDMFSGCTGLTIAPELPATTLVSYCYGAMFSGCTGLTVINVSFTSWSNSTNNWLNGVSPTGTFTKPAALPEERGSGRIPEGWTVINK